MAKKYGVEQLLPTSRKSTIFKETRLAERGLAIKGTGIGQKVKGHKWERTMETRLEERKKAMMEMPELIRQWKQVSFFFIQTQANFGDANTFYTERSRTRMEEVAQTNGLIYLTALRLLIYLHYIWRILLRGRQGNCVF